MTRNRPGSVVFGRVAAVACALFLILLSAPESQGFRTWTCDTHKCVKENVDDFEQSVSLDECKITCLKYAGLWPRPTGDSRISTRTVEIDVSSIRFLREVPSRMALLVDSAQKIFLDRLTRKSKSLTGQRASESSRVYAVDIRIDIYDFNIQNVVTHVDESYKLSATRLDSELLMDVRVEAKTYFGARHALETLSQLIAFDDIRGTYKMIDDMEIKDYPAFTHRGIALDTARSYISVDNIVKILDIMAMNKLNTFHWHMTDTHSFPYVSAAYPQLSQLGAYSDEQVYTPETIKKIVDHGLVRGVRVIPEFDAPAHVGEGWEALGKDLITCFKWEPWRSYCVEPPCGQFDPTNDNLYEILGTIFKEYTDLFPSDLFHMGGDEVNINCWKSTPRIVSWMREHNYTVDHQGFHKLWIRFQDKALQKLKLTRIDPHPKPILWSSSLTELEDVDKYLSPEEYIIQIWTDKNDENIKKLIKKKYQIIFSNYDELYLDCGGPSWVGAPGTNWCSPYKGWQIIYNHSLVNIGTSLGLTKEEIKRQILGSEAAVWTEQIDDATVLSRLWPRSAALAERLWSNPKEDWKEAQFRMNYQRQRIHECFPHAELLQPQWCYHNDGYCD